MMITEHLLACRRATAVRFSWTILVCSLVCLPLRVAAEVEPEADRILRAMSDHLAGMSAFRVTADASTDILMPDGRKVQLTATGRALVDRAQGLRVERQGPVGVTRLIFNGKTLAIANDTAGVHLLIPAEGGIDLALDEVRHVLGTEATGGSDLLYANPYEGLMLEVEEGTYLGQAVVGGVLTDHLFYRAAEIDWQLSVRAEGDPLPVKYVITSKWVTAAPQFSVQFSGFQSLSEVGAESFEFTPAAGSRELGAGDVAGFELLGEE